MAEEGELQEYKLVTAEGEELKSSRHFGGSATATYPNSDTYTGDFVDGLRHGSGKYTYAKGSGGEDEAQNVYEGEFENNEKHGIGKMIYVNKGTYYGYWQNGQRCGEGVMTYTNADVYSGSWNNGNKEGQGTYVFFATGMKVVGKWKNGKLQQGKWVYPNGTCFEGQFDNNKPKGAGTWNFVNGNQVDGEYVQTVRADVPGDEIKLSWSTKSDITKAPVVKMQPE